MPVNLLKQALDFLKIKVDEYNGTNGLNGIVEIQNIATLNDGDQFLESNSPIILSVVNIEEDKISKIPGIHKFTPQRNGTYNPRTDPPTNKIEKYTNPTQHLVVTLLFTAYNQEQKKDKYLDGISKLEHVIRCFQEKNVFYVDGINEVPTTQDHVKLILDLVSLKINELNQLWSVLGNKYMPSVMYKMRMISIQNDKLDGEDMIDKFKLKLWNEDPNDLTGLLEETKYIP